MWKKTAMFWLAAALVLGACGNEAETAKTPETGQSASDTKAPDTAPAAGETKAGDSANEEQPAAEQENAADPAATADSETDASAPDKSADSAQTGTAEETDASGKDPAAASAAQVPVEYHMNGNYDIVPNEGSTAPKKVVLLTFDDGPKEADMINGLFDTLDKHNAKAIFFVNGYRVKEHPELLKLIQERGGIVGNHSYDHIYLNKQSNEKIKQQIEDVQTIVEKTIGETPKFFRPPNAAGNDYAHQIAKENGLLYMTWSVGSLDWVNKNDPKAVVDNVFDQLHSGSNILMHELPWTVEALDDLLTKLEAKGYGFVDPRSIDTTKQP